ncbi:hypothetical protein KKB55_08525 [Myxococcota bacterium]|nr:hypothetical protein [Myxococcota bacterium]MBU1897785.1 hypothetical protein [Myxococcota bacterium]
MKLILPLLLLALGALIWALRPPQPPSPPSPSARITDAAPPPGPIAPAAPSATPRALTGPALDKPSPRPTPPRALTGPALDKPSLRPAPEVIPTPPPRAPGALSLDIAEFKDGVRRFYANRPKAGVPAYIEVDEILPRALIERLGVADDAQLVELGHYSAQDARAYEAILSWDEAYMTTIGVTIKARDGRMLRDYITLEASR